MKGIIKGVVASVLLVLYAYSVVYALRVVDCVTTPGCTTYPLSSFTDGMVTVLTLVGNLVSALVVAELAATKRGENPATRDLDANASKRVRGLVTVLTALYLLVWLVAGLSAVVVGFMQHPGVLQPLTDLAQAWLGLAISTVIAYFGINPK